MLRTFQELSRDYHCLRRPKAFRYVIATAIFGGYRKVDVRAQNVQEDPERFSLSLSCGMMVGNDTTWSDLAAQFDAPPGIG